MAYRWNAQKVAQDISHAKAERNFDALKLILAEVAEHNYKIREQWRVPRTVPVTHAEALRQSIRGSGKEAKISFSAMTTADAALHFGKDRKNVICILNFANGEKVGGGYKNGATAQEEDLCRQIPTLYNSLNNAMKDGLYPYGPCTCQTPSRPEKFSDVLYTQGVTIGRLGSEEGFAVIQPEKQVTCSMVSAAAPNIRFKKEVNDRSLVYKTIQSIYLAPNLMQPEVNVLILGAWGCGAFGGDPTTIATMFVEGIIRENYGQLYSHIHFAIPKLNPRDDNYDKFRAVFAGYPLNIVDVPGL